MKKNEELLKELEALQEETDLYDNPLTEKQKHILQAAEKLFADYGFAQTATATIAKEAGVTEKTLFKHFPTKQALLRRILFPLLLKTIMPIQMLSVKKILQSQTNSVKDLLRALALDRWAMAKFLGPRLRFVLTEFMQNDSIRLMHINLVRQYVWPELVASIESFQEKGELRSDLPAQKIAQLYFMAVIGHGMLRAVVLPDESYDDLKDVELLIQMLMEGLAKAKP